MANIGRVLPHQQLRHLISSGAIESAVPIDDTQVQPNSLDLRVADVAHRVRYSFLPVAQPVEALLRELSMGAMDLTRPDGAILETGKVYVVPLREQLALESDLCAAANPKSSTGRLDILARLLSDRGAMFDCVPPGYHGPLYLEIVPRAFPIRLRSGDSLAQLRLARGAFTPLGDAELRQRIRAEQLILSSDGHPVPADALAIDDGVFLTVSVAGQRPDETIGYSAKKATPAIDLRRSDHSRRQFWNYIAAPRGRAEPLVLHPGEFYIFASRERVIIPPDLCAEMVPYDAKSGELRTHYAGFFDSGFGWASHRSGGARVVLEVRNLDVPFLLQEGQRLFRLRFFANAARPDALYGAALASNYQGQDLRLSKHFGGKAEAPASQLHLWRRPSER